MIGSSVHGFMEFGDCGYKPHRRSESDISGPVVRHPVEQIDKPLTGDVVADEDDGKGCTPNGGAENVVHVCVSVQTLKIEHSLRR